MKTNKKINSIIIVFLIFYFVPIFVFAKTYNYPNDVRYSLYEENGKDAVEFLPGDEIIFNTIGSNIYIDDIKTSDECYGFSCTENVYIVTEKMYFSYEKAWSNKVNFITKKEENSIYLYSDKSEGKYYKSGDLIAFKNLNYHAAGINPRIYDFDDNILYFYDTFSFAFDTYYTQRVYDQGYLLLKLPRIDEKDVYWKTSIFDDGAYDYPSPHFTPIEYFEPKIELKCDKDKINYGEKTKCEVLLESSYKLRNLNFSINQKNLKLSNISYLDGVTNSSNDNKIIKLNFDDNNSFIEKKVIVTFDVEGTKDSSYLDNISLENIEYTDEIVTAKYDNLDSGLIITSTKPLINPETGIKTIFVIIPILLLIIMGLTSIFMNKNRTTD